MMAGGGRVTGTRAHPPLCGCHVVPHRLSQLAQRHPPIYRHQSGACFVVGRVERKGEPRVGDGGEQAGDGRGLARGGNGEGGEGDAETERVAQATELGGGGEGAGSRLCVHVGGGGVLAPPPPSLQ